MRPTFAAAFLPVPLPPCATVTLISNPFTAIVKSWLLLLLFPLFLLFTFELEFCYGGDAVLIQEEGDA